jgi:beta-glucosidase
MQTLPLFAGLLLAGAFVGTLTAAETRPPAYLDASLSIDERVEDLLSRMTLEEKIGQINMPCVYLPQMGGVEFDETRILPPEGVQAKMTDCRRFAQGTFTAGVGPGGGFFTLANTILYGGPKQQAAFFNELQKIAASTRLKIPLLQTEEGTHGLMCSGGTIFPEGPGLGATWNMDLIRRVYEVAAREARAVGIHQLHTLVVEPLRDPRLGRNQEGYSEDPFLNARIAETIVRAVQGRDISAPDKVMAGLAHYPGQSQPVGGLERGAMEISERALRQIFLPPWAAGIRNAGALGVMATYPAIDGLPAHASAQILTRILREELGFEGLVLSEGSGLQTNFDERVAATEKEAGELALRAGVDVGISLEPGYMKPLADGVRERRVPVALLDRAVRRVLRIKFLLGLFENRYVDPAAAARTVRTPDHVRLSLEAARESIVLLKNEKGILPLSETIRSIAVIGPNADNPRNQLGDYISRMIPQKIVTVLEGIRNKVPAGTKVVYAKGASVLGEDRSGFDQARAAARAADVAIVVVGENERFSLEGGTNGEGRDVASLDLSGVQEDLIRAVHETGTPTVVVLINGRPLSTRWTARHVPAIVEAWLPGEAGGTAVADVLFGDYNPGGRLPVTVPRHAGQLPIYYNSAPSRIVSGKAGHEWRDYVDLDGSPLYPFGHGLSYTRFEYSGLRIEPAAILAGGTVTIRLEVANTGDRAGDEVVQLYVSDLVSSMTRPVKELKGFRKVSLKPGEKQPVEFILTPDDLMFLNRHLEWVVEPGEFAVSVGRSSEDLPLTGRFTVN